MRCLPADFPEWRFDELRPSTPGLFTVSFTASRDTRPWVIVFDNEGAPRWWYSPETRALWAQVLSDGTISWARSFGDGYGRDPRMAHEVRSPAGKLLRLIKTRDSIIDGHELRELDGGNFLIDSYIPGKANLRRFGGPARAAVDRVPRSRLRPLYGIERSSGEILWKLGGSRTTDSLQVVGDPAQKLLGGQHDARINDDGSLSVYDNSKDRPRRPRVVFYRLDPAGGKATYLGQLNDPAVKASHCCGSARELENGGWLVSWGDNPLVTAFDRDRRIVFRLSLAASTFRAVPVPRDATNAAKLDRGLEEMEIG